MTEERSMAAALRRRDPSALALVRSIALVTEPGNLVARPWGGRRLAELAGLPARGEPIGESFELAAAPSDEEARAHPSVVRLPDGSTIALATVLHACPELLGEAHVEAYGPELPLLPKLLDLAAMLSIQAHPAGHPEAYVILAADPGATMRVGFREDVDPAAIVAESDAGLAAQRRLLARLRVPATSESVRARWERALGGADDELSVLFGTPIDLDIVDDVELLRVTNQRMLDRLHTIVVAPGMIVHNCAPHPRTGRPTAAIHALGDPDGKGVLALEIRATGTTYRVWDHARLPMRPVDARVALAEVSTSAIAIDSLVTTVPAAAEAFVSVDDGVFAIEHLRPRPRIERAGAGVAEVVHCTRGRAAIAGPGGAVVVERGRTAFVPACWQRWTVTAEEPDTELVVARMHVESTRLAARTRSLARVRRVVADSTGPREVVVIANGGDGPLVRDRYTALGSELFRADGDVAITVHEEVERRGQLLGLLDATAAWAAARAPDSTPRGVALGIMLPGQGTRLSPITQRLHGIKPFAPMPIRSRAGGKWLDAGSASLFSWVGVARELERMGFCGIAWKWGDEPQFPARDLSALSIDLAQVDVVRFGIEVEIDEDLARNKEWLLCDRDGRLVAQVRRRPRDELLARLAGAGEDVRALVHIGSPALSYAFIEALRAEFGDLPGWLDIDGYLFEAITHDDSQWQAEIARDQGLRALLWTCPDFHARARAVRARLEREHGRPLAIAVIDFGAGTYWGDMGQLVRAREAFAASTDPGDHGEFLRRLAAIDDIVPDALGNRVLAGAIPTHGVTGSIILESTIRRGRADGVVVFRSELGDVDLAAGTVAIDSTCVALQTGKDALVFGVVLAEPTHVADHELLTTLPRDPAEEPPVLEPWRVDMCIDPGAPEHYGVPIAGNPGSFADKFRQMRQRTHPVPQIEQSIARVRARVADALPEGDDDPPTS